MSIHETKTRISAAVVLAVSLLLAPALVRAQGGPPYYTNDPGTPGTNNWEINIGYMPFLYNGLSVSHTPDVDINFGLGERIQLTFENAVLRDRFGSGKAEYGIGQDQLGVKWRFYDNEKNGLGISVFPQVSINNPDNSVRRGITPPGASLLLPVEFTKKLGPVDINWELGYNAVHKGPDGWLAGFVIGHDVTKNLELDAEFYSLSNFNHSNNQQTLDGGLRYKIHPPFILLVMAGRSMTAARDGQPSFVGYFGMQFLLPPKPFE